MTDEIVNYAFISYKRIEPDETWAKNLHRLLNSWYIPTDIAYSERLNNNKRISPIVRDKDNFPPGNGLDETIKTALRQSRSLILILSKAMIEDQMARRSKGEHAYIFEEIEYFQSLERSQRSIIPVYIDSDNQNPSELLPPMLKGYDKLILNVNDYFQTSKRQWSKRVAAAVAAGIFQKDQGLFWDYHRKAVRKSRIKIASIILLVFIFFVGLPLLLLLNQQRVRTRIAESYGLIEQSRQARKAHDTQAALIFALEAYEKSPDLDAALSNLRQQAIPNKHEPRSFLKNNVVISSDGQEILSYDHNSYSVRILRADDLSEIETIGRSYLHIWDMSFSPDARKVGLWGIDSLWIYDRDQHKCIYAERHRMFYNGFSSYEHAFFDSKNKYYIRSSDAKIIKLNLITGLTDTLNTGVYLYNIKRNKDDVFFQQENSSTLGIYRFNFNSFHIDSIFTVPVETRNRWIYHAETRQIAYEVNDSIYRVSPRNKLFCGIGTIGSFEPNGNRLLWRENSSQNRNERIGMTDSMGRTHMINVYNRYDDRLKSAQWMQNGEILLAFDSQISGNYIQIRDSEYPYHEKVRFVLPQSMDLFDISQSTDSLLMLSTKFSIGNAPRFISFEYPVKGIKLDKGNIHNSYYTFDGRFHVISRGYQDIKCWDEDADSVVWVINATPAINIDHRRDTPDWISPNRKYCALYASSRDSLYIVDTRSGSISFEKESARLERFLSDDVVVYTQNDSTYVMDLQSQSTVHVGKLNGGQVRNSIYSIDYNGTKKICAIADSLNIYVYDLSTKNELLKFPIRKSGELYSMMLKLSSCGRNLICSQMFHVDDRNNHSEIMVWNIPQQEVVLQDSLPETYYDGLITDEGYFVLKALDRIAIYNILGRKHVATLRLDSRPMHMVQFRNGYVLVGLLNRKVLEINLKRGKVVGQKDYPGGIDNRILDGHFIMSGDKLIDLNTDKIVMQMNKEDHSYPISIQDSVMILQKYISGTQQTESAIPFEDEDALVRRVRRIIGKRNLTAQEWAQYQE